MQVQCRTHAAAFSLRHCLAPRSSSGLRKQNGHDSAFLRPTFEPKPPDRTWPASSSTCCRVNHNLATWPLRMGGPIGSVIQVKGEVIGGLVSFGNENIHKVRIPCFTCNPPALAVPRYHVRHPQVNLKRKPSHGRLEICYDASVMRWRHFTSTSKDNKDKKRIDVRLASYRMGVSGGKNI